MQHCGIHRSFLPDLFVWQEAGEACAQWPILILGGPAANISSAHPQVVKPLGITSGKIPDSAINATSERGNYEARNIRYVKKTFLPCKPLFELAIMRDPLAITTFLWSRSARSNNLITGSAKEVTYSACSQHATRAVCTTNMYPHLSLPLIATPPPIEQCNSFKRGLFGGSICTYSLWLMPWWRRKTCLPTRLLFTRV